MKITETYEWNHVHSTDIATTETTQEENVLSDIGERWEQLKDSFLRGESMEKFVKLTTSESGDWQILEVDGVEWASGHSISADDWLGLISEHFGGMIDRATISVSYTHLTLPTKA